MKRSEGRIRTTDLVFGKRVDNGAGRIQPLRNLKPKIAGNDGLERPNETIRVRPCPPAEFEDRYRPWLLLAMALLASGFILSATVWRTFP